MPYDRRPVLEAFSHEGLLEAGGVIAQLFYWELVTAEPEIIQYFRWCWSNGHDPDANDISSPLLPTATLPDAIAT